MKLIIIFIALSLAGNGFAQEDFKKTIFDGKKNTKGDGWGQGATLKIAQDQPKSGRKHLDFNAKWDEGYWASAGWNWTAWNKDADTVDLSKYRALRFWIKKVNGNCREIYVQLASRQEKGKKDEAKGNRFDLIKNGFLKKKISRKYTLVEIPVEKLSGKGLNKAGVWEIIFGIYSDDEKGKFRAYIDNVEFVK